MLRPLLRVTSQGKAETRARPVPSNAKWNQARSVDSVVSTPYSLLIISDNFKQKQNFNVGTGLSDKLRKNPPKIGAIITYRFQELTRDGVPRSVTTLFLPP